MMRKQKEGGERLYLYPHLLFEIFCVAVLVIEAVLFLAIALPPPLLREVNFAFQFSPKPAWYFLPLYELVKFFPGRLIFLGASLLPLCALLLFYAVPWLDSSPERSLGKRRPAALGALCFTLALLFLLWRGWRG